MNPLAPFLEHHGFVLLDGGLSTQLERHGANLAGELWTTRVLLEAPDKLRAAHRDFLAAGADVIASATYQASMPGLERCGMSAVTAAETMRGAIRLAREERDAFWREHGGAGRLRPLVAASLGPFGACLHDGSEYHGHYGLGKRALEDFHRPRVALLADAGADLFAFETIPSLLEAEAILAVLEEYTDLTAWISFSCSDDRHVAHGEPFADCAAAVAASDRALAVGINCLAPEWVPGLLEAGRGARLPLAVYPNSGEHWDAGEQHWRGQACSDMDVGAWHAAGARLIGGCCRTDADDIRRMKERLETALERA
jgi:homocysteine S-methyltransferase